MGIMIRFTTSVNSCAQYLRRLAVIWQTTGAAEARSSVLTKASQALATVSRRSPETAEVAVRSVESSLCFTVPTFLAPCRVAIQ